MKKRDMCCNTQIYVASLLHNKKHNDMSISKRQFEQIAKSFVQDARDWQWEDQYTTKEFHCEEDWLHFRAEFEGCVSGEELTPCTIDQPSEWEVTRELKLIDATVYDMAGSLLEAESSEFKLLVFEALEPWTRETWIE